VLHAEKVDEIDIQTIVETWIRNVSPDARPDAVIEQLEPYLVDGETVAYHSQPSQRHGARAGPARCSGTCSS